MAVLQLQKVSVSYGLLRVVNGVSLSLNTGDFLSVIGPNGAGKTTLISAISGLLPVTAGTIVYRHRDITKWKADQRARSGIGRSFQHTNLFPQLTAK
jgi:ABC-type branched-subunit amino acid transport system ATPase component